MHFNRIVESPRLMLVVLTVLLGFIYLPGLNNELVSLDDDLLIYKNPMVRGLTGRNVKAAFTQYDPELYVPVTYMSYQLDYMIGGYEPFMYHLTNLLLHAANTVLAGLLLFMLTKKRGLAFLCALFFAVHPLQVEAVAWAAARKDVLSTFFFLLSFVLFLRNREQKSSAVYHWSIACFAFGLMSKVSVVVLPVLLLLLPMIEKRMPSKQEVLSLVPYFILSVIFGIVAIFGKQHLLVTTTLLEKILMACKSTAVYIGKLIAPYNYAPIYPQADAIGFSSDFAISLGVTAALIVCLVATYRRWPLFSYALAFFLLMLVPSFSNFSKNGFLYYASDRYAYVSSIGFFLAIGLVIAALLDAYPKLWKQWLPLSVVTAVLALFCTMQSAKQVGVWQSNRTLFEHNIALYPKAAVAWNNLGAEYFEDEEYEEAMRHFETAAELGPHFIEAHANIGNVHMKQNNIDAAIAAYEAAKEAIPEENLAADDLIPYYYLGQLYGVRRNSQKSIEAFEEAADRGAQFPEPHQNLALAYQNYHKIPQAMASYERAIEVDPSYIPARYNLAALTATEGDLQTAVYHLEIIMRHNPDYKKTREHLTEMKRRLQQ